MNEAETRAELIDPAIAAAGWGPVDLVPGARARREVIAPGRLTGDGRREQNQYADYVLMYRDQKLAVIEAKPDTAEVTEGLGQAKEYAEKLQTPIAFSTNGRALYRVDMRTGEEGVVNPLAYPTPDELWNDIYGEPSLANRWREAFGQIPFHTSGKWQPRYYQHNAISKALDAIANGPPEGDRILLTMATGTGKTAVAFQIVWKLFQSRWSLANRNDPDASGGRPRVLFLADRNVLANQAFNAFGAFEEKALIRIDPKAIAKKGGLPTNGSVFFTIFQTFMTGKDEHGEPAPVFGEVPPDFFDLIIIDECHRGGAKDESSWRGILDYFSPAVQIGLTATPRRDVNADTYHYFGEPVYTYSLKEGINDGYLTPFRVRQVSTTLDEYTFVGDDEVLEGEVDHGQTFKEDDFNKIIEIKEREAKRVQLAMSAIGPNEKTLVFCAKEEHALAIRDLINQNKPAGVTDPNYCCRVTSREGAIGDKHLKTFQDNEKTIPTVLTTSRKLSTGVDALGVRHIVLLRTVKSMIEFKQIIGRGTRLLDGKDYFTVHDFVKAYEHFNDAEWDGDPLPPEAPSPVPPLTDPPLTGDPETGPLEDPPPRPKKIKITLAPGKERLIDSMVQTSFWDPEGRPISADAFLQKLYGDLPSLFQSEDELRQIWGDPETRQKLLEGLIEKGYSTDQLRDVMKLIQAEHSDLFDVLAYLAFDKPTVTRQERVEARIDALLGDLSEQQRTFVRFVLDHYVADGVEELSFKKLPHLLELKYGGTADAANALGGVPAIRETFSGFQPSLYR
ncbi:MAG: DEAD/DEAH box helicase family protein [Planctomycetota bacterium]